MNLRNLFKAPLSDALRENGISLNSCYSQEDHSAGDVHPEL